MRSLQDAGLSLHPAKRISRDLSTQQPPPISRGSSSHSPTSPSNAPPSPSQSTLTAPALSASLTDSSVHSFVSPASFGPPSPTSSPPSSPRRHNMNITEFSKAFPSIDELDGISGKNGAAVLLELPSVPSTEPGNHPTNSTIRGPRPLPSPSVMSRFPSLPIEFDPDLRPASTPAANSVISGPPSPTSGALSPTTTGSTHLNPRSPKPPTVPLKHSNLGMGVNGVSTERPYLEKTNVIDAHKLHECMTKPINVLLLDVRTRDEFNREHIKSDAVVCLEPSVLLRDG